MGLYETLSQNFPEEQTVFGTVLLIPVQAFKPEWENQLKAENVKVFQQSYNGRLFFFLKKSESGKVEDSTTEKADPTSSRGWTAQEEQQLKQLLSQGLSYSEIASRLNKSKGAVISKTVRMRKAQDLNPGIQGVNHLGRFLEALNLLYRSGHEEICLFLLKNSSNFLNST